MKAQAPGEFKVIGRVMNASGGENTSGVICYIQCKEQRVKGACLLAPGARMLVKYEQLLPVLRVYALRLQ